MNAKILVVFFVCICFASCRSTAGIPGNGSGALEAQRALDELTDKQADVGIIGQGIEDQSRELASELGELELSIESGALATSSLKKSFAEFTTDQSRILTAKESQISTLKINNEKLKGQRNTLFVMMIVIFAFALLALFIRIRKVFGFL